jgi:glycosyltransferase involved in cell wall biosynthesis
MKQPSILLVLSESGTGGMQAMVGNLAMGLADRGWKVDIAAGGASPMPAVVEEAVATRQAIALHRLPSPSGITGLLRWTGMLRRLVAELQPDQLHGHGLRTAWPLVAAGQRPAPRILVSCHGLPREHLSRTTRLLRLSRVSVAAVGPGLAEELQSHGIDAACIENGVPPAPTPVERQALMIDLNLDPSTSLVVCPARLSPQKDPLSLVRAIADVPGASLVLVGGGPLEAAVVEEVSRLGLKDRVAITGWRDDARSILGAADLLAMASHWEGQPLVAIEAALAGIPIVATDCPGVGDWLVDGVDALLSPVGEPRALARNIERALQDHEMRRQMIDGAEALGRRHTLDAMVDAYIAAYEAG